MKNKKATPQARLHQLSGLLWRLSAVMLIIMPLAAVLVWRLIRPLPAANLPGADLNVEALAIVADSIETLALAGVVVCVTGLLVLPVVVYAIRKG